MLVCIVWHFLNVASFCKELRALRGYLNGPPMRLKIEIVFHQFLRMIAKVSKTGINLTFTIAMVTKMAAKISNKYQNFTPGLFSEEMGEKQLTVFGSRGGQISPLMHVALCTLVCILAHIIPITISVCI